MYIVFFLLVSGLRTNCLNSFFFYRMMDNVLTLSTRVWGHFSTVALTGVNNVYCFVLLVSGLRSNSLNSFYLFYFPYCRMSVTGNFGCRLVNYLHAILETVFRKKP